MSIDLKKRFDRIVDILIQLQSKRIVKAQDLSNRFDVSLRTIYRDIRSLEQAGVPIMGEAGTGYSIIEGYKLPPVVFSKQEALSFIGAEKLMEKYMDKQMIADFKSAIFKVKSVLKHNEKDLISTLENQIKLSSPSYEFFNKDVPHALRTFFESIASKKQVTITYKGVHDASARNRELEPIGLFQESGFWYIVAYCTLRKDYRQFRADRISRISSTEKEFTIQHINLDTYLQSQKDKTVKTKITILTSKKTAPQLHWERTHFGFTHEVVLSDNVEMYFEYSGSQEYFARWFLMFADDSNIIEPVYLYERVKEILRNSLNHLDANNSFTS